MSESNSSKFVWLIVGAVVGSGISLGFDAWLKPLLQAKPALGVSAESNQAGVADFIVKNSGKATASEVVITLWATAPFAARTDIVKVEHSGGAGDADCTVGFYQARLMGNSKSAVPSALSTESQALLIQCKQIRPNEAWRGHLEFQGPEAVFGLMALIKDSETSRNTYARFAEGLRP